MYYDPYVLLVLRRSQLLLFFEFLASFTTEQQFKALDEGQQRSLLAIYVKVEALLEEHLLNPDYEMLIAQAKQALLTEAQDFDEQSTSLMQRSTLPLMLLEVFSSNQDGNNLQLHVEQDAALAKGNITANIIVYFTITLNGFLSRTESYPRESYRSGGYPLWMYTSSYNIENFLTELIEIQQGESQTAVLISEDHDALIKIEPYNRRGYVQVQINIAYKSPGLQGEPLVENQFIGTLVAEPAFITTWIKQLRDFLHNTL